MDDLFDWPETQNNKRIANAIDCIDKWLAQYDVRAHANDLTDDVLYNFTSITNDTDVRNALHTGIAYCLFRYMQDEFGFYFIQQVGKYDWCTISGDEEEPLIVGTVSPQLSKLPYGTEITFQNVAPECIVPAGTRAHLNKAIRSTAFDILAEILKRPNVDFLFAMQGYELKTEAMDFLGSYKSQ